MNINKNKLILGLLMLMGMGEVICKNDNQYDHLIAQEIKQTLLELQSVQANIDFYNYEELQYLIQECIQSGYQLSLISKKEWKKMKKSSPEVYEMAQKASKKIDKILKLLQNAMY